MSLIKCNECGKNVSDQAMSCPNCGAPVNVNNNQSAAENDTIPEKSTEPDNTSINEKEFILAEGGKPPLSQMDILFLGFSLIWIFTGLYFLIDSFTTGIETIEDFLVPFIIGVFFLYISITLIKKVVKNSCFLLLTNKRLLKCPLLIGAIEPIPIKHIEEAAYTEKGNKSALVITTAKKTITFKSSPFRGEMINAKGIADELNKLITED